MTVRDLLTPGVDRLTVNPADLEPFKARMRRMNNRGVYISKPQNPGYTATLFWFSRAFDLYVSNTVAQGRVAVRDLGRCVVDSHPFGPESLDIAENLF